MQSTAMRIPIWEKITMSIPIWEKNWNEDDDGNDNEYQELQLYYCNFFFCCCCCCYHYFTLFSRNFFVAFWLILDLSLHLFMSDYCKSFCTDGTKIMVNWCCLTRLLFSAMAWKAHIFQVFTCKWIFFFFFKLLRLNPLALLEFSL